MIKKRIGIAGTGFMAERLAEVILRNRQRLTLGRFYSPSRDGRAITNSLKQFLREHDVIVECSGKIDQAWDLLEAYPGKGPSTIYCVNAEFMATLGRTAALVPGMREMVELVGDQPSGFIPLVRMASMAGDVAALVNYKGYYRGNPPPDQIEEYAKVQGTSYGMTMKMADGTKLAHEIALAAAAFGALPVPHDSSLAGDPVKNPLDVVPALDRLGILSAGRLVDRRVSVALHAAFPTAGISVVVRGEGAAQAATYRYMKIANPEYPDYGVFYQNHHPCQWGAVDTLVHDCGPYGISNRTLASRGGRQVALATAKRRLPPGTTIGVDDVRGVVACESDRECSAVPCAFLEGATTLKDVELKTYLQEGDVALVPKMETLYKKWKELDE